MTIHRLARSLIALAAAHGVVCALFLGSIAAGRAAASPVSLCSASGAGDSGTFPAPPSRDLACLVSGCCGCAAPGFAPLAHATVPLRASLPLAWREPATEQFPPASTGMAEARAPPVPV